MEEKDQKTIENLKAQINSIKTITTHRKHCPSISIPQNLMMS
jgi:hypothetical protein